MRPPSIPTTIPINKEDSKSLSLIKTLYNLLIELREEETNRIMIHPFMCLPSRKDFPEYFSVVEKPIAMNKIREKIERSQYPNENALMEDFKLMFGNCKFFNEDYSQIYRDAEYLEEILHKKKEELSGRTTKNSTSHHPSHHHHNHTSSSNNSSSNNGSSNQTNNTNNNRSTSNNNSNTSNLNNNTNSNNNPSSKNNANSGSSNNHEFSQDIKNTDNDGLKAPTLNASITLEQSDSTNHSVTSDQLNGNEELDMNTSSLKVEHNHHNEASMDSSSNLSADLIASTPVEKCSLNTRRGRNADAPKRQLLTGYIIYASEIRKQVIDKNPNQNFGDISRLVGNEWKALPHDIRSKYDQRALIHNKRVRERAQRDLATPEAQRLSNGLITPKLTKRKLAKLAKEKMRQHHLSIAGHNESSPAFKTLNSDDMNSSSLDPSSPKHISRHITSQHSQPQPSPQVSSGKLTTAESCTQTTPIRFVEPPTKKRLVYSESFRKYIETLQVPNRDLLVEETIPERTPELPTNWLGVGIGRHESPEAALWALRDFMLQDVVTMRRNMEPYL